ncbi:MAG: hypothetical protein JRN45_11230 [Nitrososphaerota archaeon]|nr:hypothetical protein [Nitrososphaerota archaeon]
MPDFDDSLNEVCRSVLAEALGASGRNTTSWWLARSDVSLSDCARKPQEFDDALAELFQPIGALVIEARILARFYRNLGTKYERGLTLSFPDEVQRAKELFNEKTPR